MASTFAVTRNHLIFGLCLPLAVLMGYLLAEPFESTSLTVIVMVFALLVVPVMLRWYHPLLILSWHLAAQPMFLPGRPQIWVVMALLGVCFALLNRSVDAEFRIFLESSLTRPMVVVLVVVISTAMATGGIGFNILGSSTVGGKGYVFLVAAVLGYFALTSQPIKSPQVALCVAMFFLPGVTSIMGRLAQMLGPMGNILLVLFPTGADANELVADQLIGVYVERFTGLMPAALAFFNWMLARYGASGVLDLARPWRIVVLTTVIFLGCFGGFRSMLLLMLATFLGMLYLERAWRTHIILVLAIGTTLLGTGLILFADKLPLTVQRSLSFLPVEIDPFTREAANYSTEWRLEMWKAVYPEIPKYLFLGKGYNFSGTDMQMLREGGLRGFNTNWADSVLAGDYHNGPLSVIIPFGIWGVLAFGWLLYAGARFLYTVYRDGPEELKGINRFLLALFMARILFFCIVFGSLYTELYHFTGILGLSVALNRSWRSREPQLDGTINDVTNKTV